MLQLIDVSLKYGDKVVLNKVNLEIGNEFVALTGANGVGKSSLCRIIMGIEQPTSGRILFDGVDITDYSVDKRARLGIAYSYQSPVRFKGLTVGDILSISTGIDEESNIVCQRISEVGLCPKEFINRDFDSSISGGEAKRIEIASVLARNPKCLIFDEPEAGIDLWSLEKVRDIFCSIAEEGNKTLIIVSHNPQIINLAEKVLFVNEGGVVVNEDFEYPRCHEGRRGCSSSKNCCKGGQPKWN